MHKGISRPRRSNSLGCDADHGGKWGPELIVGEKPQYFIECSSPDAAGFGLTGFHQAALKRAERVVPKGGLG